MPLHLPTYFRDFLQQIRLTQNMRDDLVTGHTTLRERLRRDASFAPHYFSDFLQGSYVRSTAVRPKDGSRADVDIVVVTTMDTEKYTPAQVLEKVFVPFLDTYYKGKWRSQDRSIGIELSYVDLDVVITSAPSEIARAEVRFESLTNVGFTLESAPSFRLAKSANEAEWKAEPLLIPSRDLECWVPTNPVAQIVWTREKNKACNTHYVNVVKAIKWWRRCNPVPEYPKGYPVEHLVGDCCPDGVQSVAEGVTRTLEEIVAKYGFNADLGLKPMLKDHGVNHDVFGRLDASDFKAFMPQVRAAAKTARAAFDAEDETTAVELWRQLFPGKFPPPPDRGRGAAQSSPPPGGAPSGGFTPRSKESTIGGGRFA
jgi:hypothetical protein